MSRWVPIVVSILLVSTSHAAVSNQDLSQQLLQAKSESEIDSLLASNHGEIKVELARTLLVESQKLRDHSQYPNALLLAQAAEKIAKTLTENTVLVDAKNKISALYGSLLKPDLSLQYAQEALNLSRANKYQRGTADAFLRLGDLSQDHGKIAEAVDDFNQALSLYKELQNKEGTGRCYNYLGSIAAADARFDEALRNFEEALKLREEIGDQRQIAGTLNNMAALYRSRGLYDKAIETYTRSLDAAKAAGDRKIAAIVTFNIGNIYKVRGDLRASLEKTEAALKIFEELGIEEQQSYLLFGIGTTYRLLGNYDEALRYHLRGLELGRKSGDQRQISDAYCHMGAVYLEQGNYGQAAFNTRKCIDLRQSANLRENLADAYGDLGVTYQRQGDLDLALKYFQDGVNLAEELKQADDIASLFNLRGYANFENRKFSDALDDYQRALNQARALKNRIVVAETLENLGYLQLAQGNLADASRSLQESLSISQEIDTKKKTAEVLHGLAEVFIAKGDFLTAAGYASRSADLAGKIHSPETSWKAFTSLGKAQAAMAMPDEARKSFEHAIAVIDDLRLQVSGGEEQRARFFEDKLMPYDELIALLCDQQKYEEALLYAERGKARALNDLLRQGKIDISQAITPEEKQQEQKWIAEMISLNTQIRVASTSKQSDDQLLSRLNDQLKKTRSGYEEFRSGLYDAHPELKSRLSLASAPTAENILASMREREIVLEYVVSEKQTLLFVVNKGNDKPQVNFYRIAKGRSELAGQVERFRTQLANRDPDFVSAAKALYAELLQPAEAELKNRASLVIIPDREVWGLPFQVLMDKQGATLMRRYATSYAPSLAVLRDLQSRPHEGDPAHQLLAFGNPRISESVSERAGAIYRGSDLAPLPEAEKEAKLLLKLYGTHAAAIYTEDDATEARWKQESGKYRELHLATHGILNSSSPLYSYLVLAHPAEESGEDGLLEAREIMESHLSADLVVLSACETALGRIGAGEGIIGLSWAFFAAGSRATVVSQWKVSSESTSLLMASFYKNLKKGIVPAEALRLAAIQVSENQQYRHPFYWAPFVLIGSN